MPPSHSQYLCTSDILSYGFCYVLCLVSYLFIKHSTAWGLLGWLVYTKVWWKLVVVVSGGDCGDGDGDE